MTIPMEKLHRKWLKEPAYKEAYEALEPEFTLAHDLIEARSAAGLTQAEVAERMGTTQSVVARIESGRNPPTLKTLDKYAKAVGRRIKLKLEPAA